MSDNVVYLHRQHKWDMRYLDLAKRVGSWSKDPSTKVGAVLVRPDNSIASTGFNGFGPGEDDSPELYADREYKNKNVIHAEINAFKFLGKDKTALGYTIYTSFPCCPDCAEKIIEKGVRRVVCCSLPLVGRDPEWVDKWIARVKESLSVFEKANVEVVFFDV